MHGDFSRRTHRPERHYVGVIAQQGRLLLDAEANEQVELTLAAQRALARDIIGQDDRYNPEAAAVSWHGGFAPLGFEIGAVRKDSGALADLTIGPGRYAVGGVAVDATRPGSVPVAPAQDGEPEGASGSGDTTWKYSEQPYAFHDPADDRDPLRSDQPLLVYLLVQDRLVSALQDPLLRETALGPALPDTAARIRTEWQVNVLPVASATDIAAAADSLTAFVRREAVPRMAARAVRPSSTDDDPCTVAPDAGYRGPENQLYRVEIHRVREGRAAFTWSRENGSVVLPVVDIDGAWVELGSLGRDGGLNVDVGAVVELLDDRIVAGFGSGELREVVDVDVLGQRVLLDAEPNVETGFGPLKHHPFLRRWDHSASGSRSGPEVVQGALAVSESTWLDLEAGVQIYFQPGGTFRRGDHWTVAARTLDGDVEWPREPDGRAHLRPPEPTVRHLAPLALLGTGGAAPLDLRRRVP